MDAEEHEVELMTQEEHERLPEEDKEFREFVG